SPNHPLAVCIASRFGGGRSWPASTGVGKTLVSSAIIDRVAADLGRRLVEVPVGFKWFVDGLLGGSLGFGGEESAGAAFLRRDGSTWTSDKDRNHPLPARGRDDGAHRHRPRAALPRPDRSFRDPRVPSRGPRGVPLGEGGAQEPVSRAGSGGRSRRRADRRRAHGGSGKRRTDR